ncbi:MAG: Paramecium bursaria Chlorella virus 1 [Bacteroidota bacterium]
MTLLELLEKNDHYFEHVFRQNKTDKEIRHSYCSLFYDQYLLPYKNKEITLLEIGICHGGSLMLWNDYFEKGTIIGTDICDMTQGSTTPYNRITTYFEDAYTSTFINKLPALDIVIDDGPHTLDSHKKFIDLYLAKVRPGGMLIIEDIRNRDNAKILVDKVKHLNYDLHDSIDQTGNHDNLVLIIKV